MNSYQVAQAAISVLTLLGCGAVLLALRRKTTLPGAPEQASKYGSHGSSRWATSDEVSEVFRSDGAGAVLGRLPGSGTRRGEKAWRPVIFPWDRKAGNRFILIVGPPGSGKTFCYTLPNLLHAATVDRSRSLVITDPKGDLYRDTAKLMADAKFEVVTVNLKPDEMHTSCRFNPLDYVHTAEDAQRLAATIVANTEGPHSGGEAFWRHSEEALIACLIWFVKEARPPEEQHLGNVLHLAGLFAGDKPLMDRVFQALEPTSSVRRLYAPIAGLEDKTRAGVFVGVTASRLKIWASDRITALTAASDFHIRDVGSNPSALYLIIPDHDSTYRVLSSLFFDLCFQELIALADEKGGHLPMECRLLLEEMANIGRIPDLEKRLATVRSRGILVDMVLQTLGQLKALYGDAWSTIIGCADTMAVLAANDLETAQYVSQRLGTTTIRTTSQSVTHAEKGGSEGMSRHFTGRALMTPEEVMGQGAGGLREDELLLIRRGLQARITKNPVDQWPGYKWMASHKTTTKPEAPERTAIRFTDPTALGTAKAPEQAASQPQAEAPSWASRT